ncbi:MAG: molybdopterin-binding protein [Pseudomonadota bacterium]
MKFGPVPVDEAVGAILAHSHAVEGGILKKGAVLSAADAHRLAATGAKTVTVARLMPEDTHENDAALALARAIVADEDVQGLRVSGAGTGRVNLYATQPGVLDVSAQAIGLANSIDPMISVATLPQWQRVEPGMMVATIKIISYAVPTHVLTDVCATATAALSVRRAAFSTVTLIETQTGTEPLGEKGRDATALRLERLGLALTPKTVCAHRAAAIAGALWKAKGDAILILTASATSDPADVGPAAVRAAGGQVTRFGMPVDPGNLLFLGDLKGKPVIGLPGCARSPALNGADWVLERVLCGVPVTSQDIADMGVGGLLKDIPTRPVPRRRIEQPPT